MTTIAAALQSARQQIPLNEGRLLLSAVLQKTDVWVLAHDEAVLNHEQRQAFMTCIERRVAGEPIAYLLGQREFYGRQFSVSPAVLIPRPETEMLVDIVKASVGNDSQCRLGTADPLHRRKAMLSETPASPLSSILDLGTGSGCIAISIACECRGARVTAVDASAEALEIAVHNARHLLGDAATSMEFLLSDWFGALTDESFDLIVSNPPYVAEDDPHLAQCDLRFEPIRALAGGPRGLSALRHIVRNAAPRLAPGGRLLLEHGFDQGEACRAMLASAGFANVQTHRDLAGIERVTLGQRDVS